MWSKKISNILPDYLALRFTIEQLSLLDLAADQAVSELYHRREHAKYTNDDTVDIQAINRRIKILRRAQRVIRESIDS